MKLQFDKDQVYQLAAIQSVVDLFKGQPLNKGAFESSLSNSSSGSIKITDVGIGNNLVLTENELFNNLNQVQINSDLKGAELSTSIEKLWLGDQQAEFPNYSIEMETGTGKTYVYLRSIYELNKVYGLKKFVIVVPSVAIREGVLKALQITAEHFGEIYGNQPADYKVYDACRLTGLANFAKSNAIQILVINIDSFTKDINVINQVRETGVRPIEYIQKSNPIVIIDEPQNMETDIRKRAIANLNPLFTLRYSATHKNLYNLIYKLDPVKAYDLGLVKQIEVDSVIAKNDSSGAFISLDGFKLAKNSIIAQITLFVNTNAGLIKKQVRAKIGNDLFLLSKGCTSYKDGFVINQLDAENDRIEFSSGYVVYKGQATGGLTDQVLKEMIDATVENHFKKEKELNKKGIKVLSIFFIDRVANYRAYDEQGNVIKGKYVQWFEESFLKWQKKPAYKGLYTYDAQEVHNGYFSQDKGKLRDSKEGKPTKADDETFKLIMQDKERLLDLATPLRFIFSHSALREGWDNPNVFQICTLNETKSDVKKRQEIGRGLRLCVDQSGLRNLDRDVNRLTIIANEAYESFSKALQNEIEEECGVKFEGRIKKAREGVKAVLKDQRLADNGLLTPGNKIRKAYPVQYSSEELIQRCVIALKEMPAIAQPTIHKEKNLAKFIRNEEGMLLGLASELKSSRDRKVEGTSYEIPDLVTYMQSKTKLTRASITAILLQSGRLAEVFIHPQLFMDTVARIIKHQFNRLIS